MDIYVGKASVPDTMNIEPNPFDYDMSFKHVKKLGLNSDNYPLLQSENGYSVTVYVHGIDEKANNLLNNSLKVNFQILSEALTNLVSLSAISFAALIALL